MTKAVWIIAGSLVLAAFAFANASDPVADCVVTNGSAWTVYADGSTERAVAHARTQALCEAGLRERGEI